MSSDHQRPVDISLPQGWTWERVEAERAKVGHRREHGAGCLGARRVRGVGDDRQRPAGAAMSTTLEVEPVAVTLLTGRMGTLVVEERGEYTWRGELLNSGKMGRVEKNGLAVDKVPVWLQRKLARATVMMQSVYPVVQL